jgi:hypothetical protein
VTSRITRSPGLMFLNGFGTRLGVDEGHDRLEARWATSRSVSGRALLWPAHGNLRAIFRFWKSQGINSPSELPSGTFSAFAEVRAFYNILDQVVVWLVYDRRG